MPTPDQELVNFLARFAKPYDPATDAYNCPPLAADIKSEGRSEYYNFHYYHTKVPPEVIRDLITHYTSPGDVILDPFCGSGMTGLGAWLADYVGTQLDADASAPRPVILKDLSPAACHIAENYNSVVDPARVTAEFEKITATLAQDLEHIYDVEHYEPAVELYDTRRQAVAARLGSSCTTDNLLGESTETKWTLLSRSEVEERLGFPASELTGNEKDVPPAWLAIPATMQYTVWSDVYICQGLTTVEMPTGKLSKRGKNAGAPILKKAKVARGCGGLINLWDCAVDKTTSEISDFFRCPHCGQTWKKLQLTRSHSEPVYIVYRFQGLKATKDRDVPVQVLRSRRIGKLDEERIADASKLVISSSFKDQDIDPGREMMRHGLLKRGVKRVSDFYTHRNLYALAIFWREISAVEDESVRQKLRFCFTSQVMRSSRLRRMRPFGPGEQLSGTLYIAALTVETNVLRLLSHAVGEFCETFPRWMQVCPHLFIVRTGNAAELSDIPDASVDFVFTDPPFGKNIFYADCAMLWENWLGIATDERDEIVVNERRVGGPFKTAEDYGKLMESALLELFRVLKPGRYAVLEFNNSDISIFDTVKRAIFGAGFQIVGMSVFDKGVKTFKQLKGASEGEAVLDKDILFTLIRPSTIASEGTSAGVDFERLVADTVRRHLETLPDRIKADPVKYNDEYRTTGVINTILVKELLPTGISVKPLNLQFIERVCARYFRKLGPHWYLRGEPVGANGEKDLFAKELPIRDEVTAIAWLRQKLQINPMLIGELKPLWMRAPGLLDPKVSQSLVLEDLLTENFWPDAETNRWREPTPEERDRINDDRSLRVLHDAERFVGGTLRRQTTDNDRCQWIDVLFQACRAVEDNEIDSVPALRGFDKAEAYALIPRLFQSVLGDHVSTEAYSRAQKQASVASQRLQKQAQEQPACRGTAENAGQGTLDFNKST